MELFITMLGSVFVLFSAFSLYFCAQRYYYVTEELGYETNNKIYIANVINIALLFFSALVTLGLVNSLYIVIPLSVFMVYRIVNVEKDIKEIESE